MRDCSLFRRSLLPESTVHVYKKILLTCIALNQNSITNFIKEFDRSNSSVFGVAWKPTSTFTKWWGVRPKPCLCASDDWLSDEYVSLMAAVLHCISHQVMSVVHHFAIEWWQG